MCTPLLCNQWKDHEHTMNDDNDGQDDRPDDHDARPGANPRRAFLRTAAAAAAGAGVLAVGGEASASAPKSRKKVLTKKGTFRFSANFVPAALTKENITQISDAIASQLAQEAKAGVERVPLGFHIRIGGGHSRVFSKTAEHKNVGHSEVIIEGSFP